MFVKQGRYDLGSFWYNRSLSISGFSEYARWATIPCLLRLGSSEYGIKRFCVCAIIIMIWHRTIMIKCILLRNIFIWTTGKFLLLPAGLWNSVRVFPPLAWSGKPVSGYDFWEKSDHDKSGRNFSWCWIARFCFLLFAGNVGILWFHSSCYNFVLHRYAAYGAGIEAGKCGIGQRKRLKHAVKYDNVRTQYDSRS